MNEFASIFNEQDNRILNKILQAFFDCSGVKTILITYSTGVLVLSIGNLDYPESLYEQISEEWQELQDEEFVKFKLKSGDIVYNFLLDEDILDEYVLSVVFNNPQLGKWIQLVAYDTIRLIRNLFKKTVVKMGSHSDLPGDSSDFIEADDLLD